MRTSSFVFLSFLIPAPALLALEACNGKSIDVGTNSHAAAIELDAAPGTNDGNLVESFAVDDVECTVYPAPTVTISGTKYTLRVDATCRTVGPVHALLIGDSSMPYPQACGARTYLWVEFDTEVDGAFRAVAEPSRIDCTIQTGPTATSSDGTLSFTSPSAGFEVAHRVKYVGKPTVIVVPEPVDSGADTGPTFVDLAPDAGRPPHDTCLPIGGGCTFDSDCDGGAVWGCGLGGTVNATNLCLTRSTCRGDGDCATGHHCVLSNPLVTSSPGNQLVGEWALGYFCTTPADDCTCPAGDSPRYQCAYSATRQHWGCYGRQ